MADTAFTTATATLTWVSSEQLATISRAEEQQRLDDVELITSTYSHLQASTQSNVPLPTWQREHLGRLMLSTAEPQRGSLLGDLPQEFQPRKVKTRCVCQSYMNLLSKMFANIALEDPDKVALRWACRTALPEQDGSEVSTLLPSADDEESVAVSAARPESPSEQEMSDGESTSEEPDVSFSSSSTQARSTTPDTDMSFSSSTGVGAITADIPVEKNVARESEALWALSAEVEIPLDDSDDDLDSLFGEENEAMVVEDLQASSTEDISTTMAHVENSNMEDVTPTFAVSAPIPSQSVLASDNVKAKMPEFGFAHQSRDVAMEDVLSTPVDVTVLALPAGQLGLPSFSASLLVDQALLMGPVELVSSPGAGAPQDVVVEMGEAAPLAPPVSIPAPATSPPQTPVQSQAAPLPQSVASVPSPSTATSHAPNTTALPAASALSAPATHSALAVTSPSPNGEESETETQCITRLLWESRNHFLCQPWVANFLHMFDLAWDDKTIMPKIVQHIIKHRDWGNGDFATAKDKIHAASSEGAFSLPILIWTCCMFQHKMNLQPVAVTTIKAGARNSFEGKRAQNVRLLFDAIARSTYFNIIRGLAAKCLTWTEMQELAVREDIDWLGPRYLNTARGPRDQLHYDRHMVQRKTFWTEFANMRAHIEALHPETAAEGAGSPSRKRGGKSTQEFEAKRARPLEEPC